MNIINYLTKEQLKRTKILRFKKGTTIFQEEEKCDSIGIIQKGRVEIFTYLINGEKVVYNSINEGEFFGSNLIFSSHPFYKGNVVAMVDSTICIIEKEELKAILSKNEEFLVRYLNAQSDFTKRLNFRIKLLSISSARERILFALENNPNKTIEFKTVSELGDYLGLTRESTSRAITKLVDDNLIEYKDKKIALKKSL